MSKSRRASCALTQSLAEAIAGPDAPMALQAFAEQAAADALPDELPELSAQDLATNLADFWRFAERRRGRAPIVRIAPVAASEGVRLDRLEIVQDDCPFLVDSVMGEIADQGLSVRAMFHPIVEVRRDRSGQRAEAGAARRESMIQVILEPIGADREAAVKAAVAATLADVHAAVDDFPAMLELARRTLAEIRERPGKATPEEIELLSWLEAERFVFLGARIYQFPRLANGDYAPEEPLYQAKDGLGILRDPERTVLRRASEPAVLMGNGQDRIFAKPP